MNYTAEVQHSEETFQRLAKVQHNEYGIAFKFAMMIIGAGALFIAVSAGVESVLSVTLLLAGGLAFSGLNMPAQRNAEKLISLANGTFPHTKYVFGEKELRISSGEYNTSVEYTKIYDILEDNENFFLFLNSSAGYMIPKKSVCPADLEGFAAFLEEKIRLKRHRVSSLLTLNVRTRLQRRRARVKRLQNREDS